MTKVLIDSQNRISLPHQVAREIGSRPLELASASERHLFFFAGEDGQEVVLAGIVGEVGIPDVLSFFNMFRKTGILSFSLSGGSKDLYFDAGEIVFASSTFPEEDLGEILFSLGKVNREILQKARQFAAGRTRLGKLLVEKKVIASKDLWLATRQQVEAIVYDLFTYQKGSFSFLCKSLEKEDILRLSLSTQNLIMEGLRRVDERALYMRRIGSLAAVPAPTGKTAEGLAPPEQRLLEIVSEGKGDVREVLRRAGLGEFEGLRLLYQLTERKLVEIQEPPPASVEGELGEILAVFNGALAAIQKRVSAKSPRFRQDIQFFLRDLPQPFSYVFKDVLLLEDGTLEGGRILANLAGLEEGDKKKLLADGLSELIYMECHLARKELGVAGSADLLQKVQEVSRRIKALIGRKE